MKTPYLALLALIVFLSGGMAPAIAQQGPEPIQDAQKEAFETATEYLAKGFSKSEYPKDLEGLLAYLRDPSTHLLQTGARRSSIFALGLRVMQTSNISLGKLDDFYQKMGQVFTDVIGPQPWEVKVSDLRKLADFNDDVPGPWHLPPMIVKFSDTEFDLAQSRPQLPEVLALIRKTLSAENSLQLAFERIEKGTIAIRHLTAERRIETSKQYRSAIIVEGVTEFEKDKAIVYIDRSKPLGVQAEILIHELVHAMDEKLPSARIEVKLVPGKEVTISFEDINRCKAIHLRSEWAAYQQQRRFVAELKKHALDQPKFELNMALQGYVHGTQGEHDPTLEEISSRYGIRPELLEAFPDK